MPKRIIPHRQSEDLVVPAALTEEEALHNVETAVARAQIAGELPPELLPIVDAIPVDPAHKEALHAELFPEPQADADYTPNLEAKATWPFPGNSPTVNTTDHLAPEGGEVSAAFQKELTELINRHSIENSLGMPDFVIADLMCKHLNGIASAVWRTFQWKT